MKKSPLSNSSFESAEVCRFLFGLRLGGACSSKDPAFRAPVVASSATARPVGAPTSGASHLLVSNGVEKYEIKMHLKVVFPL